MAGSRKSQRDDALVLLLAAGETVASAAAETDISERTIYRRLADPDFRRRVADTRAQFVREADGKLRNSMNRAADILILLLDSPLPAVKLKAATALLKLGYASFASRGDGR